MGEIKRQMYIKEEWMLRKNNALEIASKACGYKRFGWKGKGNALVGL